MKNAPRIGSVFGIELRVDWSVIIVFALLAWGLATVSLPSIASGYSNFAYWLAAIGATVLFLASLLAHETSHSVVARKRGIAVHDITLWLFGGVSSLESEARTPRTDFEIAIAGPATSIAIGVVSLLLGLAIHLANSSRLAVGTLVWLGGINIFLALFNLVPAAPLDGGRVLRAWLWHRSGDHDRASVQAARAGSVFAWILIALGVLEFMAGGDLGGLWLVFLGWFLLSASRNEEMQVNVQHALHDVRVRDVMTASPVTVPASMTIEQVLDDFILAHRWSSFPVVETDGRVDGLLTLAHVKTVPRAARATTLAREAATPLADVTTASPDDLLLPVLQRPSAQDGRVLVMDNGHLAGIITPSDVSRTLQHAQAQRH
jgi:Zn-dependent protease/CBS domain-containing protein